MTVEWLLSKAKEKFYPITHAKAVVTGNGNETVSDAIISIKSSINSKANNSIVSDEWNNTTTYSVGQYCIYSNSLWKCKVQHNGQIPAEGTYWTKVSVSNEISSLNSSLSDLKKTTIYKVTSSFISEQEARKYGNVVTISFNTNLLKQINRGDDLFVIESGADPRAWTMGYFVSGERIVPLNISPDGVANFISWTPIESGETIYVNITYVRK